MTRESTGRPKEICCYVFKCVRRTGGVRRCRYNTTPLKKTTFGWVLLPNHFSFWSYWRTTVSDNPTKSWATQNQIQTSKDILVQPSLRLCTTDLHLSPCRGWEAISGRSSSARLQLGPARRRFGRCVPKNEKQFAILYNRHPSSILKTKNNPVFKFFWEQRESEAQQCLPATRPRCLPGAGARSPAPRPPCPTATRSPEQNHQHLENYEVFHKYEAFVTFHKHLLCTTVKSQIVPFILAAKKIEVQPSRLTKALKLGQTNACNIQKPVARIVLKDSQTLAARFLAPSIPGGSFRWEYSLSTQTNREGRQLCPRVLQQRQTERKAGAVPPGSSSHRRMLPDPGSLLSAPAFTHRKGQSGLREDHLPIRQAASVPSPKAQLLLPSL